MITLKDDTLTVRFPHIHPDAVCEIEFQRTLRIPDDNRTHYLPPGLGKFALKHVDDHADKLPAAWQKRGGVFLPMHETEAVWIRFQSKYPFAVKIAAGKINAVTGKPWTPELKGPHWVGPAHDLAFRPAHRTPPFIPNPDMYPYNTWATNELGTPIPPEFLSQKTNIGEDQDYLSVPRQPWLDGFCVERGKVRQFVALPMGSGFTVEEQLTGEAIHGGLQILVYPLKPEFYVERVFASSSSGIVGGLTDAVSNTAYGTCANGSMGYYSMSDTMSGAVGSLRAAAASPDMGMAPGGLMKQNIYEDSFGIEKFDQTAGAKCFVHLLNAEQYQRVTGKQPPHRAPTAEDYTEAGMPWFCEGKNIGQVLPGAAQLKKLDSVANHANKTGHNVLGNQNAAPAWPPVKVVTVRNPNLVREGGF